MSQGLDLNSIYSLRTNFTIIGLTGKTGSGCSDVANQLVNGFSNGKNFTEPEVIYRTSGGQFTHNAFRKHRIIFEFASHNFVPFTEIKYKDVITLFLLSYSLRELNDFLKSPYLRAEFENSSIPVTDFEDEIRSISDLEQEFLNYSNKLTLIDLPNIKKNRKWDELYSLFFGTEFRDFSRKLHLALGKNSDTLGNHKKDAGIRYHKTFQVICDNLRKSGNPYNYSITDASKIFSIVDLINKIIKSNREGNSNKRTQIVINSLKNPLEIMFFKQRFSGFYSFAINKDEDKLWGDITGKFTMTADKKIIEKLLEEEYKGGPNKDFFKQRVEECLQLADVHISFISSIESTRKNKNRSEDAKDYDKNSTPFFSWQDQLLKYISLIHHPGLVAPSSEERCMQLAFTAKYNSGCISRQVGAAISDENYAIKAIGWNDTPEGQIPCALRKIQDLLNNEYDFEIAYTAYERGYLGNEFRQAVEDNFREKININVDLLNGRNLCYCFKSIKNSFSEGKNQVHTRSLHAEESAFLQISKYGGQGIRNGILFSTASPCELCSKKAYQLGIKIIYFIDPYPGISNSHILTAGSQPIDIRPFNGAIGSAYHKLYHSMMNYKDEIGLLLDQNIIDITSKYRKENIETKKENERLLSRIKELEASLNNKLKENNTI
jgi:deoxycytidylate deaminase